VLPNDGPVGRIEGFFFVNEAVTNSDFTDVVEIGGNLQFGSILGERESFLEITSE